MRIKSYFAGTVEGAIAQARRDLGSDAMLLKSRRTPEDVRHLGDYEVVFGIGPAAAKEERQIERKPVAAASSKNFSDLCQQVDEIRKLLSLQEPQRQEPPAPQPALEPVLAELLAAGLESDLAAELLSAAEERWTAAGSRGNRRAAGAPGPEEIETAVVEELKRRFTTSESLSGEGAGPKTAAFVGAPGAGKTTTLLKLSVKYGLALGRSVQIFALESGRVGSTEQLRLYAEILGFPFQSFESAAPLGEQLRQCRGIDLILIDTPGFGPAEKDQASELAAFLSHEPNIDTHLVIPASMNPRNLRRTASRFEGFGVSHLVFTRLDEIESFGSLISEGARLGKPVAYLTAGQQIPEDISTADGAELVDVVLREWRKQIRTAA